jgi:hypothetical protein
METRLLKCREINNRFLQRWDLNSVKKMTIEQYVDTKNPDTFCQWLETQTIQLGSIKGFFSKKFGIYKRNHSEEEPPTLVSDNVYTWLPRYGKDRKAAFAKIKEEIIEIIVAAQAHDFKSIDKIPTNHLVKWKIAFLYSGENLIPIFKKEALRAVAEHQGLDSTNKETSELQQFIFDNRPLHLNIYQYASELFQQFGKEEQGTSYYLIGSKYGGNANEDMFPLMEQYDVVCTGFASDTDLSYLYRKKESEIVNELKALGEDSASYSALKQFLQLKPGDIIAVKSNGSPRGKTPNLEIIAYAVVVERGGVTYWHDPQTFGHCINIEFIKTGLALTFQLGGYGRTVHSITDDALINQLFHGYRSAEATGIRNTIKSRRRKRVASSAKNTAPQRRKGSAPYVASAKHNQIQMQFKEHLEDLYGEENVFLEENNVDIKVLHAGTAILYEVKPYAWAEDCIRAGLGQLLAYTHFDTSTAPKKIIIVGPYPADADEQAFIVFLKNTLSIGFDYEHFNVSD